MRALLARSISLMANRLVTQSSWQQRRVLIALGAANAVAVIALAIVLARSPNNQGSRMPDATPNPVQMWLCRQATSRALFEVGHSGVVQTNQDGSILIELQRPMFGDDLRLNADGSTWAAFEAVVDSRDCVDFETVQVIVHLTPMAESAVCVEEPCDVPVPEVGTAGDAAAASATPEAARTLARVRVSDLLMWYLGEIDDSQLTQRVDYFLPVAP